MALHTLPKILQTKGVIKFTIFKLMKDLAKYLATVYLKLKQLVLN